jgi:sugar phosphate isomerase/epimerase
MSIKRGVSLYSLQEDYFLGHLDLEGCIAKTVNEIGAEGIEWLPDQMPLPSFPNYTEADIDHWHALMAKYKAVPTCYSVFLDYTMFKNRMWTVGESVESTVASLKQASQMGFKVCRSQILARQDIEVFEKALPAAEFYGVQLCTEIHSPRSIHSWWTQDLIDLIERKNTRFLGFVPDFGIFCKSMPIPYIKRCLREGASEKILNAINEGYRNKAIPSEDDVLKMGGGKVEQAFRSMATRYIYDDPAWLKEVIPYTQYCHGKFYEMNEACIEESIDYENTLRTLKDNGFDGYIASEYEGQRHYFDQGCNIYMDPVEQCRRHHIMMKKYLGEE